MDARQLTTLAIAILFLSTAGAARDRSLQQFTGASCQAIGSLQISVLGAAACSGWAKGDCQAHSTALQVIKTEGQALATSDLCQPITSSARIIAIANSISEVFVRALAQVTCYGQNGFACGFFVSNGRAWGEAYAEALVGVFSEAYSGELSAVCLGDIRAIASGIADALSSVQTSACAIGTSTAKSFGEAYTQATVSVIADAVVQATARVCNVPNSSSSCEVDGAGGSDLFGSSIARQDTVIEAKVPGSSAGAVANTVVSATKLLPCQFPVMNCCFPNTAELCPEGWTVLSVVPSRVLEKQTPAGFIKCKCW